MGKKTVFFDANCFSEISDGEMRSFVNPNMEKIVLSSVLREIQEGYKTNPDQGCFRYALNKEGELNEAIKLLDLSPCNKNIGQVDYCQRKIKFKELPLICSSYYSWIPYALRPCIITNPFWHVYNDELGTIGIGEDLYGGIRKALGKLRSEEIKLMGSIRKEHGKTEDEFEKSVLTSARRKKTKSYRKRELKITDYQILTSALIYTCFLGTNTFILSCDKDLIIIFDELIESIKEKYVINALLEEKMSRDSNKPDRIILNYNDIQDAMLKINKTIRKEETNITLNILYYQQSDKNVYFKRNQKIPVWLRDFVLEYKLNLDCISIDQETELKYPLNYVMDPVFQDILDPNCANPEVPFIVNVRKEPFCRGFKENCEEICKYSAIEREDPYSMSGFL